MFLFEKLEVYKSAVDFAELISTLTGSFPKGNGYLIDQISRASVSISLNIAEGNGRFHTKDRKNFFYIARGSAHECVPLLELCKRKGLLSSQDHASLIGHLEKITRMLSGLISGADNRQKRDKEKPTSF